MNKININRILNYKKKIHGIPFYILIIFLINVITQNAFPDNFCISFEASNGEENKIVIIIIFFLVKRCPSSWR